MKSIREIWNMLGQPIREGDRQKDDLRAAGFVGIFVTFLSLGYLIEEFISRGNTVSPVMTIASGVTVLTGLLMIFFALVMKNHTATITSAVIYCLLAFTLGVFTGHWNGTGILWSLLLPIAMCCFISVKYGIVISIFYSILYMILFYTPIGPEVGNMFPRFFALYFPLVYLAQTVLISIAMIRYHRSALREIEHSNELKKEFEQQKKMAEDSNSRLMEMSFEALQTLAEIIDAKDPYTKGHSARVSQYAAILARGMGWPEERVESVRSAALLHDIGKIGIPDAILNKPQRLNTVEYEIIKTHTTMGGEILRNGLMTNVAEDVALSHHERYDGTGYPRGLKGTEISEEARLVAIADAFDTMNSNRIYRNASNRERIRRELENGRGKQFDPEMTDMMLRLWEEGSLETVMVEKRQHTEDMDISSAMLQEALDNFASENQEEVEDTMDALAMELKDTGSYEGALDVEYRQFAKLYEFIGHLEKRFDHPFRLILITLKSEEGEIVHADELERAMAFMDKSIRQTIRNVDVVTQYDLQHFMVILLGTDEDGIRVAMDRIFRGFFKMYGSGPFTQEYTVAASHSEEREQQES